VLVTKRLVRVTKRLVLARVRELRNLRGLKRWILGWTLGGTLRVLASYYQALV
jgi:hypothetical protein